MTSPWYGKRTPHRNVAGGLDQECALERIEAVCGSTCAAQAALVQIGFTEEFRDLEIQNQLLDDMKAEFQEFLVHRVYIDVEREGIPPPDTDRPPAAPRAGQEEEDSIVAHIANCDTTSSVCS